MAMIVTGRYILQFKIYYHFFLKKVFLDFTNHDPKKDVVMVLVMVCFLCSLLHFALDFFFPPYVTMDKVTIILTGYLIPCAVFFMLMHEASAVERRLNPLPKFVEEDTQWAKQHLAECEKYLDSSIKHNAKQAERKLYFEKPDHKFELNELLDEIILTSRPVDSKFHNEPDHGAVKHGVHGMYKGLWPGRILLCPYLKDEESRTFKKVFMIFVAGFIVIQCAVLVAITMSAVQEGIDAVPGGVSHDAFHVGGEAFERMGFNGYCRDEGHHRPPGYFIAIDKLEGSAEGSALPEVFLSTIRTRAQQKRRTVGLSQVLHTGHSRATSLPKGTHSCALHCSGDENCIGFAMDHDLCNVYLGKDAATPEGWDTLQSIHRTSTVEMKDHAHDKWAIVTTDHSMGATCFIKLREESEPENVVACIVYGCHILVILWVIYKAAFMTFKLYFMKMEPIARAVD
jgi:hypothetical protein